MPKPARSEVSTADSRPDPTGYPHGAFDRCLFVVAEVDAAPGLRLHGGPQRLIGRLLETAEQGEAIRIGAAPSRFAALMAARLARRRPRVLGEEVLQLEDERLLVVGELGMVVPAEIQRELIGRVRARDGRPGSEHPRRLGSGVVGMTARRIEFDCVTLFPEAFTAGPIRSLPILLVLAVIAAVLLGRVMPLTWPGEDDTAARAVGYSFGLAGIALIAWAAIAFRRAHRWTRCCRPRETPICLRP